MKPLNFTTWIRLLLMGLCSPLAMAQTSDPNPAVVNLIQSIDASSFDEKAKTELSCKIHVLKELGWDFEPSTNATELTASTTGKCGDSHSMKILVPTNPGDAESWVSQLNRILVRNDHSFCVYKKKLSHAVVAATKALHGNKQFNFRDPSDPFCSFNQTGHWISYNDNWLEASTSPSRAIEAIYDQNSSIVSDCAVGLQTAQLATQYELYESEGPGEFDRAFKSHEISVGKWGALNDSDNPILGYARKIYGIYFEDYKTDEHSDVNQETTVFDPTAKITAAKGSLAFVGLGGFVGRKEEKLERYVDDRSNRGQNFMILSTSQAGMDAISNRPNGLKDYDGLINQIYKKSWALNYEVEYSKDTGTIQLKRVKDEATGLMKSIKIYYDEDPYTALWVEKSKNIVKAWLEGGCKGSMPDLPSFHEATRQNEIDYPLYQRISGNIRKSLYEMMELLNDPFLRDTRVYIHPKAIRPLSYYVFTQLEENPRVPPHIQLYSSTVNSEMFTRYLDYRVQKCVSPPSSVDFRASIR